MASGKQIVTYGAAFTVGIYFLFLCIVKAKPFLAPFATAIVLALLMLRVCNKIEKKMKRITASLLSTIFLFLVSAGFIALIGLQVQTLVADWDKAEKKIMPQIEKLEQYVYEKTPLKEEDIKKQASGSVGSIGKYAMNLAGGLYSFGGDYLLTLIYVFFLLNYRSKFRRFLLRMFPVDNRAEVAKTMTESVKITSGYLYGKFLLMIFLAVLYAIGMGISGVSNFIVISLLAALLTIIPYIGNIIGFFIALGLGYVAEGDTTALIGIVITFFVVQFVETYFFEPYVVGDNVNLDPLMIILAVVAGSLVWGVIGMILSVPVLGMVNVVFKHVRVMQPYHYLLSIQKGEDNK